MFLQDKSKINAPSGNNLFIQYKKGTLLTLTLLLALSVGSTAWSYDGYDLTNNYNISKEKPRKNPSFVGMDLCLPLLKMAHVPNNPISIRSKHTAGKVAALGMILGVRFALEPKKGNLDTKPPVQNNKQIKVNKGSKNSARSIAAYRKCQKRQALISVASRK